MVESADEALVAGAHLDGEGSLTGRRGPEVRVEVLRDDVGAAEAPQTRGGEDHRVEVTGGDPREAGLDVAADVDDLDIRPLPAQLRHSPR